MAIAVMKKLILIGMDADREALLAQLQKLGCVELIGMSEDIGEPAAGTPVEETLARLIRAIDAIEKAEPEKRSLFAGTPVVNAETAARYELVRTEAMRACDEVCRAQERQTELRAQCRRLEGLADQMRPYEPLDMPLEEVGKSGNTVSYIGTVPVQNMEPLREAAAGLLLADVAELGKAGDAQALLAVAHVSAANELADALRKHGFTRKTFGETGSPAQLVRAWEDEAEACRRELEELDRVPALAAEYRDALKYFHDELLLCSDRMRAAQSAGVTGHAFYLSGWLAQERCEAVERALLGVTATLHIAFDDPSEGETPPTVTENTPLVGNFEAVTDMFSTPSQSDIDPNAFIFPFFVAFFGMMMADAGYGIIMAVAGWLFIKILKPKTGMKKLAAIIALGGLGTIVWGLLFGGFFSISSVEPILFSPMYEPLSMMGLCFGLGALHIFTGIGISAWQALKKGDWQTAVFDKLSWILLIVGLVLLFINGWQSVGLVMAASGGGMILLFAGREHGWNIVARLAGGFGSLYGITGYLSDILSYSRIFAMGLAGAAIGMVFNTIAGLFFGNPVTYVFGVIILIIGHTFNIVINALGAYIHTSRLQYIEFFGKFYQGGGIPFRPFAKRTKYVEIKD